MKNPASGLVRDDLSFVLRRKTQKVMSNLASKFGWRKYDPKQFKIEYIQVTVPQLSASFRNYRIAHITDIHYGQWISSSRLEGVVDLINKNNPDLIAITGDFVSYLLDDSIEEMSTYLRELKPNDLTVAVLGDHDYWVGAEKVRRIMKKSNICDIGNNVLTLSKNDAILNIAGVDSVRMKKDRLDLVLEKMPLEGPAILLVHEPDFAIKTAATKRFNLQLSGHSHGGQFIIPKLGTPIRGHYFMKYPVGLYEVDSMTLYTNRGIGTNSYWFRINAPPEITIITLK